MQTIYRGRALKIVDAHTHIYPEKIAAKATASVGEFYGVGMPTIGTPHALVESGEAIGVSRYLVCSVATKPDQSHTINQFIAEKCRKYPQFLGFGALHPTQPDWADEIARIQEFGLRGVKFHPDFQHFNIDDEAMLPIYRALRDAKLPVLFHMGDERYDFSAPQRLMRALGRVEGLTVLAAHFGGYCRWEEAVRCLAGLKGVFFDTSSSLWRLTQQQAVQLVRQFGPENLLFGTDFPMWDHATELSRFLALELTDEENDLILSQNFERLFGLTQ